MERVFEEKEREKREERRGMVKGEMVSAQSEKGAKCFHFGAIFGERNSEEVMRAWEVSM